MKLATFEVETPVGPVQRVGVVDSSSFLDVTAGYGRLLSNRGNPRAEAMAETVAPPDMIDFLRGGEQSMVAAEEVLKTEFGPDATGPTGARIRYEYDEVRHCSPLPRPNSIRDFMVYEDHGEPDKPDSWYEYPPCFKGNPDSVVPPDTTVEWPSYDDKPDFELEIGAVIGRTGQDISPDEVDDYIAGFTIFNDFSAREIQFKEMEATLGPSKGKDFANGLGPYIVTPGEFDPETATAIVRVNGTEWVQADVGKMYHSFGDIIAHASMAETIHVGDLIASGTVAGCCGFDLDRWVEYGDTIELAVTGLGTLSHRIVA